MKLKIFSIIILISLIFGRSAVSEQLPYELYPAADNLIISCEQIDNIVTISIINNSSQPLNSFFITVNSDSNIVIDNYLLDGSINQLIEVETAVDVLYPGDVTTRFIINTITRSFTLSYRTNSILQRNIFFSGYHFEPFFGVANPINYNCCFGVRGNMDSSPDQQVDIGDLLYLIEHMFSTPFGPAPLCPKEGDIDNNGQIDISDLLNLVEYSFSFPANQSLIDCN